MHLVMSMDFNGNFLMYNSRQKKIKNPSFFFLFCIAKSRQLVCKTFIVMLYTEYTVFTQRHCSGKKYILLLACIELK